MNTQFPSAKSVEHAWRLLDAKDQVLGRLASKAAMLLMGKHKPMYAPFLDTGDFVVIINADKVRVTGSKGDQKVYRRHSGYPGGLKETPFRKMRQLHPGRIIRLAVAGMLPKNSLGKGMIRKLKVYAGDKHPHEAQQPVAVEV